MARAKTPGIITKHSLPSYPLAGADAALEALNVPAPVKHSTLPRRIEARETLPDTVPAALEGLPELMAEVAMVSTLEAAFALFEARGGNRVYIPSSAADDHWLVKTVGREAADKLIAHFVAGSTGIEIELPRGPTGARADTWRRMHKMIAAGATSTEITRALGISRDTVKYHRAKIRDRIASDQLDMLDWIKDLPEPPKRIAKR